MGSIVTSGRGPDFGAILAPMVHVVKYYPDETIYSDTADRNVGNYYKVPVINPNFETNTCETM